MADSDLEYERYKDWDMSGARSVRLNPMIKQLQDNLGIVPPNDFMEFFDRDVRQIITQHNTPQDRARVNAVIRALYVVA